MGPTAAATTQLRPSLTERLQEGEQPNAVPLTSSVWIEVYEPDGNPYVTEGLGVQECVSHDPESWFGFVCLFPRHAILS